MSIRCSVAFHRLANDKVKTFADGVGTGFFGNITTFPIQPVTQLVYDAQITTYETTRSDYENGGETQRGPFLVARTALMDTLDLIVIEVDKAADGNADTIILAGFEPTKAKGITVKPEQVIASVKRGIGGELIATCIPLDNANHYGCIMTEAAPLPDFIIIDGNGRIIILTDNDDPTPMPGPIPTPAKPVSVQLDLTDQRIKKFQNLKHDVTYYFYFYAVNAKGVGPMSEVVSLVCW